ncbi:MAG: hypothetical protein WC753_00400 [Candidatus Gracilibacteria bacterium]|jgi:hypothetical protein
MSAHLNPNTDMDPEWILVLRNVLEEYFLILHGTLIISSSLSPWLLHALDKINEGKYM